MKDLKRTNTLLLIIAVPVIFYLLKILSFIFIPLVASMFIALLFLPLMRWLKRRNISKTISIIIVVLIIGVILKLAGELIKLSSNEILASKDIFIQKAEVKLTALMQSFEDLFGTERTQGENILSYYLQKGSVFNNFGSTLSSIGSMISMTLMTLFFVILLLSESVNFQELMNNTIFKQNHTSVRTFMKIEKDIIKFVWVKFIISLFTGVGFTIACLCFDISFPIFWGLFAFIINFVQMVGSIISVIFLTAFAFIEIDSSGTLLVFVLIISGVQALMGGVLEPIFMGKTFSINVLTVLVMLMFWGYIWGVPGLIMSIPITVFVKIVLDQFPSTKVMANFMSGQDTKTRLPKVKKG